MLIPYVTRQAIRIMCWAHHSGVSFWQSHNECMRICQSCSLLYLLLFITETLYFTIPIIFTKMQDKELSIVAATADFSTLMSCSWASIAGLEHISRLLGALFYCVGLKYPELNLRIQALFSALHGHASSIQQNQYHDHHQRAESYSSQDLLWWCLKNLKRHTKY